MCYTYMPAHINTYTYMPTRICLHIRIVPTQLIRGCGERKRDKLVMLLLGHHSRWPVLE